ncbi:methyl-accepting chemotaxis protein [Thiomicrorhabdus aquaedulcis]|uniref:methyl-accepting chemotaxis protein n=1 Tax=Thiomicrorhabdus aquaedulcis TaxID=2211106 RepID=UPI000FDC139B|nr:methyl-accepting chemotaxis protein [Thiomicrorhabdus aquaedulcis]
MQWFLNLNIRSKLISLVFVLLGFMAVIGFVGVTNASKINALTDDMYQKELLGLSYIKEANINLIYQARALRSFLLAQSDETIDAAQYIEQVNKNQAMFNENMQKAEPLFHSQEAKNKIAALKLSANDYMQFSNKVIEAAQQEQLDGLVSMQNRASIQMALKEAKVIGDVVDQLLTDVSEIKEQNALQASQAATLLYEDSKLFILVIMIASLLIGLSFGLMLSWRISRNIKTLAHGLQNLSSSQRFDYRASKTDLDETGLMADAINTFLTTLQDGVNESSFVINAIAKGDFSQQVLGRYNGDLEVMKQGVNDSATSVAFMMSELSKVMTGLEQGQFDLKMDTKVPKAFSGQVEGALQSINTVITEVNLVMHAMKEGRFETRVNTQAHGMLAALKDSINSSMNTLESAVKEIAHVVLSQSHGDLTQKITGQYHGELQTLKDAINTTAKKLTDVVSQAVAAANIVSSASEEVSQGSLSLSERVQEQAAALEETSATMDQMNSAVQQNTDNARQASTVTQQVQHEAHQGVDVMEKTINAMNSIQQSSHKIADIVSLIDGIAFQTNLLALNAAVEAARAGEHGRGFAVVASEVRNLAQKSAEAAKDIKTLISESVARIDDGTKLAAQSGEVLQGINQSINGVAQMIEQIAQASVEQSQGISQVHVAIGQIDSVTQQNAALVEETSAAAASLSEQANVLQDDMAFFNIGQGNGSQAKKALPHSLSNASNVTNANNANNVAVQKNALPQKSLSTAQAKQVSLKNNAHSMAPAQEWSDF